jgi:hypothetical protein
MGDKMEYTFYNDAWIPPNINPDLSYAIKTDIEISGSDDFSVNNLTSNLVLKRNKDGLAEYITKDKYVQFLQSRITKLESKLKEIEEIRKTLKLEVEKGHYNSLLTRRLFEKIGNLTKGE